MTIEILIGSPRKNGNTFILSNHLNDLLSRDGAQSSVSYLYDYEIKPCADCRGCKSGSMKCVLKDDAHLLFDRIEAADAIVIGTPIYWFSTTAKTKLLIDRLRPYFANKRLNGKKGAVILSAGSGDPDCDLTIEMFKRIFDSLGIKNIGAVTAEAYDAGDVIDNEDAIKNIFTLSENIIKS